VEAAVYRFGNCRLDLQTRELYRDEQRTDIQPKVFDLLTYLLLNRDRVVDKDELLEQVWAGTVVSDTSLSQSIRKARSLIGDDGNRQEVIRTVQRRGYRFVAEAVPAVNDLSPQQPTPVAVSSGTEAVAPPYSIAVLPFVNISSDEGNEYFADGLAEELLNLLARLPQLRVAARTSSFAFRNSQLGIREIAEQLRVANVLEGSVRKSGNRIRVTAQLIESATGYHLSTQTFDRNLDDIFQVQDEIAAAVVRQLTPALFGELPVHATNIHPDAYTLYLRGRHEYRQSSPEGFANAIRCFQQALEVDPGLASAWDLLGMVYIRQADMGITPADEAYMRGRQAIEKATEIDAGLVEAHAHLAWISMTFDWDFTAAQGHIDRALSLDPRNYTALAQAGALAFVLGQLEQSVALREQALSLDPVGRGGYHNMGSALLNSGRYDEAEAMFQRALSISPDYIGGWFYRGLPALLRGDAPAALACFERERDPGWRLEGRAMAYWRIEQFADSDTAVHEITQRFPDDMSYQLAEIHAFRGEIDLAFDWLNRAVTIRDGGVVEMLTNPLMVGLHDDPRWLTLLQEVGLPAEGL
jgi:TolB-like protein/lipoprotein NlpI